MQDITAREWQVIKLLKRGLKNREIAAELDVTEKTVKFHITNINKKLMTETREEIATMVLQTRGTA